MAQTILYYPNINIQDGAWLRNAILYWDEISSIVPYENYPDFSPELLYLQNLGVYKPIYPQELFFSEFAEDFSNSIVKKINAYDRYRKNLPNGLRIERSRIHKNKIYAPALHELIHYEKLPQNLLSMFKEKRYVNDYNTDGWMEIDSKVAQIYMRTLAEYSIKCSNKDIVLGTDTINHSCEIYSNARNRTDVRTQCCKINIENCLPQPSMDVSYEDILNFKKRRKDELHEFKSKIRELETNIYHADSLELIKHYENQFIENWERYSKDFYKVLKESRITYFLNSLISIVGTPFVGELLAQRWGSSCSTAIQTGAQFLNIGIDYFNYKNKISTAKTDGGFSYIIKAKNDGIIQI